MLKRTVINNHEVKRNLFGTVTIDGCKTPLRFSEAVKAVSQDAPDTGWKSVWNRQSQEWVTVC